MREERGGAPFGRRTAALLVATLGMAGCFEYVPAETDTALLGRDVRIYLAPDAVTEVKELSVRDDGMVDGVVVRDEGDWFFLRVPVRGRPDVSATPLGQDVRIPKTAVRRVDLRQIDRVRSGVVGGLAAVAAGAVMYSIMSDAFGGTEGHPPVEPQLRTPAFLP